MVNSTSPKVNTTSEFQERIAQARRMQAVLERRPDSYCVLLADPERYPAPLLGIHPVDGAWDPHEMVAALKQGTPPIYCKAPRDGGVDINMHCLIPGEAEQILDRFDCAVLAIMNVNQHSVGAFIRWRQLDNFLIRFLRLAYIQAHLVNIGHTMFDAHNPFR